MEFSRQEYWSGLPFPSPGDLSNPGIKSGSPALQAVSLPSEPPGKHGSNMIPFAISPCWVLALRGETVLLLFFLTAMWHDLQVRCDLRLESYLCSLDIFLFGKCSDTDSGRRMCYRWDRASPFEPSRPAHLQLLEDEWKSYQPLHLINFTLQLFTTKANSCKVFFYAFDKREPQIKFVKCFSTMKPLNRCGLMHFLWMHTHTRTHTLIYTHTNIHTCTDTHVHSHTEKHVHTHTHRDTYTHTPKF